MKKYILALIIFLLSASSASAAERLKILIVPGHDDESTGAEFRGVKEADLNLKLGLMLYDLLKRNKNFEVFITRNWDGYLKEFADYFENRKKDIEDFKEKSKAEFESKVAKGEIRPIESVHHADASPTTALKLYGLNLWSQENNIDAIIHIHFNDNPRPNKSKRGKYSGFAIYVPERQLKESQSSYQLAAFIFSQLLKYFPRSNYEKEKFGIIPDQTLIAVSGNDSLITRRVLIEYGYIYEKRFSTFKKREKEMKLMAQLTADGLKRYFKFIGPKFSGPP